VIQGARLQPCGALDRESGNIQLNLPAKQETASCPPRQYLRAQPLLHPGRTPRSLWLWAIWMVDPRQACSQPTCKPALFLQRRPNLIQELLPWMMLMQVLNKFRAYPAKFLLQLLVYEH